MQVTLDIKESRVPFFMELIQSLDYVRVIQGKNGSDAKNEILENIKQGLKEVQLIEQGKMKSRPAKEFLDEL